MMGPSEFDLGLLIAHLTMNLVARAIPYDLKNKKDISNNIKDDNNSNDNNDNNKNNSSKASHKDSSRNKSRAEFVLECIGAVYTAASAYIHSKQTKKDQHVRLHWEHVIGVAGVVILRRLIGVVGVSDFEQIEQQEERAQVERKLFLLAEMMLDVPSDDQHPNTRDTERRLPEQQGDASCHPMGSFPSFLNYLHSLQ